VKQEDVVKFINYDKDTGKIFWIKRRSSFFKTEHSCKSWNTRYSGKEITTIDGKGYRVLSILGKRYLAHRLAWLYVKGEWPNVIDHINGDRLDNRFANLRNVTNQQNHMNCKMAVNNTSGATGVYKNKVRNIWCAQMKFNGVTYHLGSSRNFEDAVRMRKEEEIKLGFSDRHGENNAK